MKGLTVTVPNVTGCSCYTEVRVVCFSVCTQFQSVMLLFRREAGGGWGHFHHKAFKAIHVMRVIKIALPTSALYTHPFKSCFNQ